VLVATWIGNEATAVRILGKFRICRKGNQETMRSKPPSGRRATPPSVPENAQLWMVIDPETREALRFGEGPTGSGPAFFSSEAVLRAYCAAAGLDRYQVHVVPATVLHHMRGKPFWLDTRACSVDEAARLLRGASTGDKRG
jgi:hypothetical protein